MFSIVKLNSAMFQCVETDLSIVFNLGKLNSLKGQTPFKKTCFKKKHKSYTMHNT